MKNHALVNGVDPGKVNPLISLDNKPKMLLNKSLLL